MREQLEQIPGVKVQAKGRCATQQGYYVSSICVDDAMLKPGIDIKQVYAALKAEGTIGISPTWGGQPVYTQQLWSVPKKMYRIESNDVAEKVIRKQQLGINLTWLMAKRGEQKKLVEALDKVLSAYRA